MVTLALAAVGVCLTGGFFGWRAGFSTPGNERLGLECQWAKREDGNSNEKAGHVPARISSLRRNRDRRGAAGNAVASTDGATGSRPCSSGTGCFTGPNGELGELTSPDLRVYATGRAEGSSE